MKILSQVDLLDYVPHVLFIWCFVFVRGNWVTRNLFFLYFDHVRLWDTGVYVVWIKICHLKFFLLWFSVRFSNKLVMCYKSV